MSMRYVIPPLGVVARTRATFLNSATPLPPDLIEDVRPDGLRVPRWLQGVTFQSLGCDPLTRIESIMCGYDEQERKEPNELGDIIDFDSFTFYDGKLGATICTDIERLDGDIQIRVPAMVSEQLGEELMEGGARRFDPLEPWVNPSLATAASLLPGGPFNPNDALALLEQAAADFLHGAQATLHLTPRGFSALNIMDQGMADPEGRWSTAQGNLVIADAGYHGPEPLVNSVGSDAPMVDADEWWYSSGPVAFALTNPQPLGLPYERIDYAGNRITNIYEGFATVIFDPCAVVAIPVCYDDGCVSVD